MSFICPNCDTDLPGTAETQKECYFCGWKKGANITEQLKKGVISISLDWMENAFMEPYEKARWTLRAYHGYLSWREIARYFKAPENRVDSYAAQFSYVSNGGINRPAVLVLLGLEPETKPAPVCPECNEVHTVGWCVKVNGPPVKPKPVYNKRATHPSPDDIVSFTVKMTRAQREQINETAKGRGVTTKEMIYGEYLNEEG